VTDPTPAPKRVTAMDLRVAPVTHAAADAVIQREHYSGKTVSNSQLHFGVFIGNKIEGAMQFGPSMDKRKIQILVRDTPWNGFLELNRMAFSERLPRNSESRAIGIALRLIRKAYPHIQWVVSFADGTQCGDGTIYRASNFLLTGVKESTQIVQFPDGARYPRLVLTDTSRTDSGRFLIAHKYGVKLGGGCKPPAIPRRGRDHRSGLHVAVHLPARPDRARAAHRSGSSVFSNRRGWRPHVSWAAAWEAGDLGRPARERRGSDDPHAPSIRPHVTIRCA
jgi:hypothetical protein